MIEPSAAPGPQSIPAVRGLLFKDYEATNMGTTLHTLKPPAGARKRRKRVGRGIGSGRGKTATRGQKGQLARHNSMPAHFEGGQNPLQRRVPKRGFVNIHRTEYHGINVARLEGAESALWVLVHPDLRSTARVRAVADALFDYLRGRAHLLTGDHAHQLAG